MGQQTQSNESGCQSSGQISELKSVSRLGIALCLSGGGFRAALFHLGALRRLNELGILNRVRTISSVSGGSIMAAHLATQVVKMGRSEGSISPSEFDDSVARPIHQFTSRDIRTWPVLKRFLLPWNWHDRSTQVRALEDGYSRRLTPLRLRDLPERPNFIFCATELGCGVNWEFQRTHVGHYRLGYQDSTAEWTVAKAVAASSCFPPVFDPMKLGLDPQRLTGGQMISSSDRDQLVAAARLSDGGVYDNLGLEPVQQTHSIVMVSDGGAPFRLVPSTTIIKQWKRYFEIAGNQVAALRKRWLISDFEHNVDRLEGAYWGIGSAVSRYGIDSSVSYTKQLATDIIARIRTDMDGFSTVERAVLENHGYLLADAAIQRHLRHLVELPLPQLNVPFPEWMDERRVRAALRDSHQRIRFI